MQNQLLILPFDHRSSFVKNLLGFSTPLDEEQKQKVKELKQIVFNGFREAVVNYENKEWFGILVDEEFGSEIGQQAKRMGVKLSIPVEKSGQNVFDFEYGANFGEHIKKMDPDYVKVLVRYNPENVENNKVQIERLKSLSNYCQSNNYKLLFELLVPPTAKDLEIAGNKEEYEKNYRAEKTARAISEIKEQIKVDVWKIEGFSKSQWKEVIEAVGPEAKIIFLGRGESQEFVERWLQEAGEYQQIIGFAIGRTIFYDPLKGYLSGAISQDRARDLIAGNFKHFVDMWINQKGL